MTLTFVDATTGTCPQVATRTWTATDDCGNSSTATQTINIADTTAPVIAALPGPTTIECTGTPSFAQATATDACDPTVTLTFVDATTPGSCAGNYSVTRTWTATDDCNNTSTATQTINVADTTAPLISGVGGSATIECPLTPVFSSPTASDACGAATLSFADVVTPGSCPQQYSVTRTWTATDACGLKSTASQTINVVDTTGPTIGDFSPASVEVCFGSPVTVPTLTATDACSGAATVMYTRSDGKPLGDPYPVGTTTVTAKAVDACGNSSVTRTFTVVVKDCAQVFCSLTQGGWGNSNGKFNGEVRIDTIKRLITAGSPLIIGSNGRTISFTDGFEQCLIDKMPAGGPAAVLPVGVVDGCNVPAAMLKNGKLNSVIWGQTIALSMNVRLDPNLGGKALCKTMITAKALPGPDGKVGTSDDILEAPGADLNLDGVPDNYLKVTIPNSVIQGISTLGLGAPTVNNILALANRALGGQSTGGASLGDINAALDAINQGFDECRFLMSCTN